MSDMEANAVLDGISHSTWAIVIRALNGPKGFFCEFETGFLTKDFIRKNQSRIKRRIKKNGYIGKGLKYIEINIDGYNGYAFYCTGKKTDKAAQSDLRAAIEAELK